MNVTLWSAEELALIFDVAVQQNRSISRVVTDSRIIQPGDLFVALKGERFDGHDFVAQSLEQGAKLAIVDHAVEAVDAAQLIVVEDTEKALQQLGVAARERMRGRVVGVTGSVGKTGCKEMLSCVLSTLGKVHATQGNYNNQLGVPITLANMPADTDYAVIEMGMNHAGEISLLSGWVRPHVAVITTIDEVHIEFFDSIEGIADAKAEIFDGMGEAGVAVLNADNPHFERLQNHAVDKGLDRVLSFGASDDVLCQMLEYRIEDMHSVVRAVITGTHMTYRIGAIGKQWGLISVAVLGVVDALEGDLPLAAEALQQFSEPKGRGQISQLAVEGGHLHLIDDAYNASPVSMQAAFEKMAQLHDACAQGYRLVAVLGDMLELGERSVDLHVGLVPSLVNNHIDVVFAAGTFMKHMYEALPDSMRGAYDISALGLAPKVVRELRHRDIVLVKGSHGSKMHQVVDAIEGNARDVEAVSDEKNEA